MQRTPTADQTPQQRSLFFLTRPDLWPHRPFLPLVRRRPGEEEELGVVFDALHAMDLPGYSSTVVFCNLLMLPPTLGEFLDLPKEVFDSPEDLIAAGWRVD